MELISDRAVRGCRLPDGREPHPHDHVFRETNGACRAFISHWEQRQRDQSGSSRNSRREERNRGGGIGRAERTSWGKFVHRSPRYPCFIGDIGWHGREDSGSRLVIIRKDLNTVAAELWDCNREDAAAGIGESGCTIGTGGFVGEMWENAALAGNSKGICRKIPWSKFDLQFLGA